jgi:hypothetical protein
MYPHPSTPVCVWGVCVWLQDPDLFGVSVCTVDGQRFDIGDVGAQFSIQSCVKVRRFTRARMSTIALPDFLPLCVCVYVCVYVCVFVRLRVPVCPRACACALCACVGVGVQPRTHDPLPLWCGPANRVQPLVYAMAVEANGLDAVHRHVGIEPSGLSFNSIALNKVGGVRSVARRLVPGPESRKRAHTHTARTQHAHCPPPSIPPRTRAPSPPLAPLACRRRRRRPPSPPQDGLPHNPMVNAGAIATGACLMPLATMSNRLRAFTDLLTALSGGGHVGCVIFGRLVKR